MLSMRNLLRIGCGCLVGLAAGCAKPTMEMHGKPPRPPELDKLDSHVGTWDFTIEMTMGDKGKPVTMRGTSVANWECDRRVLVERLEGDMGPEMGRFYGISMVTWDPIDKKYDSFFFDNMGELSHGEMKYDEATRTWHGKGRGRNMNTGEKVRSEETSKMIDNNTVDFSFTQWSGWKKIMEAKGTSRRKAM